MSEITRENLEEIFGRDLDIVEFENALENLEGLFGGREEQYNQGYEDGFSEGTNAMCGAVMDALEDIAGIEDMETLQAELDYFYKKRLNKLKDSL